MRTLKIKKCIAIALCTVSMIIAETSSSMCLFFLAKETKMPKSLYKVD
ncbi:cyclic lactone autoinducer peptide [Clostridium pasteurianum]|nr:cyclic lactone autoinducer peptide [Clostridium pasteurianum]UZW16224.1 cyclic lactone autoinducer peptide [Clostridium pasteurianum]